ERGCTITQEEADADGDDVADPDDQCPNTPIEEEVDLLGCSDSQKDDDNDLVSNAIDQCPNTPIGAEVDDIGCIVEGADSDGDGVEDIDDLLPGDPSQWASRDGDVFGDNLTGTQGDACPDDYGNSTEDRFGCPDRDEDGYSDGDFIWTVFSGADAFPDDPTQWKDSDNDGVGDNASSSTGDKCPSTAAEWRHLVDETGCDPTERDSDSDGVVDMNDNCPDTILGDKVDAGGCMIVGENQNQEESTSGNMDRMLIYGGAGLGALVLLVIIVMLVGGGRGIDLDDDDDDDDDWFDDEEDDIIPSTSSKRGSRDSIPARGPTQAPSSGPSTGPPGRGPSVGPPGRGPGGGPPMDRGIDPYAGGGYGAPPTGGGGYGFTAPSPSRPRAGPPVDSPPVKKATKKKILSPEEVEAAKQEENRQQNWEPEDEGPLFDDEDAVARQDSVAWAWDEIQISTDDRSIMMTLQGSGWSAKQSRAILNEAKAW
ncbi:MSCRAMM family adhesin SdrC, partial [Deltaproteobacteria bacterium]|nr:MSCRAMM family adhesin SdrC [Deltaproteobacteria bacterium]